VRSLVLGVRVSIKCAWTRGDALVAQWAYLNIERLFSLHMCIIYGFEYFMYVKLESWPDE
jgi:hypothetical protein